MKARICMAVSTLTAAFCQWQLDAAPQNFVPNKVIGTLVKVAVVFLFASCFFMVKTAWLGPPKESTADAD